MLSLGRWRSAVFFAIVGHAKVGMGIGGFRDSARFAAVQRWRGVLGCFEFSAALQGV